MPAPRKRVQRYVDLVIKLHVLKAERIGLAQHDSGAVNAAIGKAGQQPLGGFSLQRVAAQEEPGLGHVFQNPAP